MAHSDRPRRSRPGPPERNGRPANAHSFDNAHDRHRAPDNARCVARTLSLGRTATCMNAFQPAVTKPVINAAALDAIDIRVGTILEVIDLPAARHLVKLTVDFGDRRRCILAGIKQERENPKEIEGRQALFVVNIEPRTMMGETSDGMLLDIGAADGVAPVLAIPERPVPCGARAG